MTDSLITTVQLGLHAVAECFDFTSRQHQIRRKFANPVASAKPFFSVTVPDNPSLAA